MPKETTLLLIALCLVLAGVARAEDWSAWQRAYDPATRTRFIPVELWTGAPWDSTQEIRMAPAALQFGRRGDKSIEGPTTWNGIQVYERMNRDKVQFFGVREDRTGLGRVFDSRYPQLGGHGTDMRYVYSPLRGLVDVQGNE